MQTVLKPLGEVLASISLSNRVQGRSFVMLSAGWGGKYSEKLTNSLFKP